MADKPPSNNVLPLDPDDELTRPEVRPALRPGQPPGEGELPSLHLPPDLDLGPELRAAKAASDDDEVTQVDTNRRRLANPEGLLPPPDLPDFE